MLWGRKTSLVPAESRISIPQLPNLQPTLTELSCLQTKGQNTKSAYSPLQGTLMLKSKWQMHESHITDLIIIILV